MRTQSLIKGVLLEYTHEGAGPISVGGKHEKISQIGRKRWV